MARRHGPGIFARLIKLVATLVSLAAIGWVAWWFVAARGQEAALSRWFEARAAEGWQAEMQEISITGFPDRFLRTLVRPRLADPEAGWAWTAPFLTAESPAWDPTNLAVTFAHMQTFGVPGERADVSASAMDAVLSVVPGTDLRLREGTIRAADLVIAGQTGWTASAKAVSISAIRRAERGGPKNTHDLTLDAEALTLPKRVIEKLDPSGLLDPKVDVVALDAVIVPDRPLDRHVIEDGRLGLETLVLRKGAFSWDDMTLDARGRLEADAEGLAEGEIDVSVRDWRRMIKLARASGALGDELAEAITAALELMSLLNGSDALDVTLRFSDGRMRLGPVAVGDAPRLLRR